MSAVLDKARPFFYRNARPLDLARFQFHFEGGSQGAVLGVLSAYQNADGGFGHALEADAWNPNSTPIQTWAATEILREVGCTDAANPLLCGILRYLASGADFDGHGWASAVQSNNDFPHAPWWHMGSASGCHNADNPSASLAGFIVRFAKPGSEVYRLGCRIVREAFGRLMALEGEYDMHTIACYIRMVEYCRASGANSIDLDAAKAKLRALVAACITADTTAWGISYVCKPSQFISSIDSRFYPDNQEIAEFECDFIARTQGADGVWPVTWRWEDYPEEWAVSKRWWMGDIALKNLLYLKGIGRL